MLKTAHINILETSNVTLTAGTEDSAYPLYRLYDRNIGRVFRPTAAETIEITIDKGASKIEPVDRLLIPAGHTLDGMTLDIMHSDDDVTYTPAAAQWVQSGDGVIEKSWTAVAKRYWKFIVTSPASVPELAELFLTSGYAWPRDPARPAGPLDYELNMISGRTSGGQDRFQSMGPERRRRSYHVPCAPEAQAQALLVLQAGFGARGPFWMYDHAGQWMFGKLEGQLDVTEVAHQTYSVKFDFVEVLP
jgi:hypothetical protein